jgi:hypothetical protein
MSAGLMVSLPPREWKTEGSHATSNILPALSKDSVSPVRIQVFRWFVVLLLGLLPAALEAQTDQQIYTDSLQNGWVDYSWAIVNYANSSPVHSGVDSIGVKINSTPTNWQAIYIHHDAFDSSQYASLTFWINGGPSGGQQLRVQAILGSAAQSAVMLPALPTNGWQQITVPLSSLGVANQPNVTGFWIIDAIGAPQPVFYLDDITLVSNGAPPVTNINLTISVDAQLNRHPINPFIYGVAFASSNQLSDLNAPLNRSGGNAETRYNWLINAHNRGADWYFESLSDGSSTPGAATDSFVADSKNGGSEPLLTVSMIGSAPKLGPSRAGLASYAITNYGPQTGNDSQWFPQAGNGVGTNSVTHTNWLIVSNNINDANFVTNSSFQQAWVRHLTNLWGVSTNGGVRYYIMDNEHSIWHSTHRDVHPVGATMQEIRDKFFDYAGVVKSNDPSALVLAPEEWGWSGYFYSGYDQQYGNNTGNWGSLPDRNTNGGWDYMPWLLDQINQRANSTGKRLLDYFTLHYYPQGSISTSDTSPSTQLLRNRTTRSLWDTNYVDPTWINSIVMLIPRMKSWVATYYPGTKIGITEYNWGGEGHINGATAQADVLGIFGREGLDLATRWGTPTNTTPTYKAMKMYRNYDGNKSSFGDTSVTAISPDPDNISAFAAVRSKDNTLTTMVIDKHLTATGTVTVAVANLVPLGVAQAWQLTSNNVITRLADFTFTSNAFTKAVPPQSITLFVVPTAPSPPQLRVGSLSTSNTLDLWLDAQSNFRYVIQSATNFSSWTSLVTNTPASNSWHVVLPASNRDFTLYRARWLP